MARRVACSIVLALMSAGGCAANDAGGNRADGAPLIASAVETDEGCRVQINGESIASSRADEELVAFRFRKSSTTEPERKHLQHRGLPCRLRTALAPPPPLPSHDAPL